MLKMYYDVVVKSDNGSTYVTSDPCHYEAIGKRKLVEESDK
jgi:hypothetical protein